MLAQLVALVMVLRALVPPGFMPALLGPDRDAFGFVICRGATGAGDLPQTPHPDEAGGDRCPFAVLSHLRAIVEPPVQMACPASRIHNRLAGADLLAVLLPSLRGPARARAPPGAVGA